MSDLWCCSKAVRFRKGAVSQEWGTAEGLLDKTPSSYATMRLPRTRHSILWHDTRGYRTLECGVYPIKVARTFGKNRIETLNLAHVKRT